MKRTNFLSKAVVLIIISLTIICNGCNKKEDATGDVVFEPLASFSTDVIYITNSDQTITAQIYFTNYSSYSDRWLWQFENQGQIETEDINLEIVKEYPATATARTYEFKLTAYSDVRVGVDDNGEVIYKTYENTKTQYVSIKQP